MISILLQGLIVLWLYEGKHFNVGFKKINISIDSVWSCKCAPGDVPYETGFYSLKQLNKLNSSTVQGFTDEN